jgi:hypothetical protein
MITPTAQRIPYLYQVNPDAGWSALSAKLDALWDEWEDDALKMMWIAEPEKCPAVLLAELDFLMEAGVMPGDTDRQARQKIVYAIEGHKKRGLWTDDIKTKIDIITGYSAAIFRSVDSDDFIELAQQATDPASYYWATEQPKDGSDDSLGCWEVNLDTPVSYVISGYVSIDLHPGTVTAVLPEATIDLIHDMLVDSFVPAYMVVRLGYVNAAGQYVIYPFTKATI